MKIEVWEDIWFLAVGERGEYSTDIKLYEISAFKPDNTPMLGEYGDIELENHDMAESFADGWVKWDGCSEWVFDQFHCCTVNQLSNVGEALARCWEMASGLINEWNDDVAEGRDVSE